MLRQAEEERQRKEYEAKVEREKQVAKVTAERAKRDTLLKSIQSKQKLLLKECYSRPIYNFNRVLHENQVQNEDFSWLKEAKNSELQQQSINELLKKIEKLSSDVDRDLTALQKNHEWSPYNSSIWPSNLKYNERVKWEVTTSAY